MPVEYPGEEQHSTPEATSGSPSTASPPVGGKKLSGLTNRAQAVRVRLKSHPVAGPAYKITVGIVGVLVVVAGLIMVPLAGPGWLIVIVGLMILASEFEKARGLLDFVKDKVQLWTNWIAAQGWPVRLAIGAATFIFVATVMYAVTLLIGVPSWVPGWAVPPLPGLTEDSSWPPLW